MRPDMNGFNLMKFSPKIYFILTLGLCMPVGMADKILLNNGESLEGKVISEDATHYLFEIQVTKTIRDEKKILKTDVKSIAKKAADTEDFEKLKGLIPTPDLMDVREYEEGLKKLDEFATSYPQSTKLADVKSIREKLNQELTVVREGGFKLSGELIKHEDYQADAYTYDQKILVKQIQQEISRGSFIGSLRLFSQFEANFSNGQMRAELLPEIRQVLTTYRATLADSLASFDERIKMREDGLAKMSPEIRADTEKAIQEQLDQLRSRFEKERTEKNFWVTPDAYLQESIVEALRQVDTEMKRLDGNSKRVEAPKAPLEETYRNAWSKLPTATEAEQKEILENAKKDRMPEAYLAKLRERVNAQ